MIENQHEQQQLDENHQLLGVIEDQRQNIRILRATIEGYMLAFAEQGFANSAHNAAAVLKRTARCPQNESLEQLATDRFKMEVERNHWRDKCLDELGTNQ